MDPSFLGRSTSVCMSFAGTLSTGAFLEISRPAQRSAACKSGIKDAVAYMFKESSV